MAEQQLPDWTRNDCGSMPTLNVKPFPMPALGFTFWLKELDCKVIEEWEQSNKDKDGKTIPGYRARLLLKCLCDRHSNPIFKDSDIDMLARQLNSWIGPLFDFAFDLNTMSKAAVDDAKKNCATTRTGASDSVSRLDSDESTQPIPINSNSDSLAASGSNG